MTSGGWPTPDRSWTSASVACVLVVLGEQVGSATCSSTVVLVDRTVTSHEILDHAHATGEPDASPELGCCPLVDLGTDARTRVDLDRHVVGPGPGLHCRACRAITRSAASTNCGTPSSRGSRPCSTARRFSTHLARASARVTIGLDAETDHDRLAVDPQALRPGLRQPSVTCRPHARERPVSRAFPPRLHGHMPNGVALTQGCPPQDGASAQGPTVA